MATNGSLGSVLAHAFVILIEVFLLGIQFLRMKALAFDVLPDLADARILFIYGDNVLGIVWVLAVIFASYVFWELIIRLNGTTNPSRGTLGISSIFLHF